MCDDIIKIIKELVSYPNEEEFDCGDDTVQ